MSFATPIGILSYLLYIGGRGVPGSRGEYRNQLAHYAKFVVVLPFDVSKTE